MKIIKFPFGVVASVGSVVLSNTVFFVSLLGDVYMMRWVERLANPAFRYGGLFLLKESYLKYLEPLEKDRNYPFH